MFTFATCLRSIKENSQTGYNSKIGNIISFIMVGCDFTTVTKYKIADPLDMLDITSRTLTL